MRTWQSEHGSEYAVPSEITGNPAFVDQSWHNEACPHFMVRGAGARVSLWVEHPDRRQRGDTESDERFIVCRNAVDVNDPEVWEGQLETVLCTDDLQAAINCALTLPKVINLANEFSRVLRQWLTPEQIAEVIARNSQTEAKGDYSVCHTHDFCDSNQAMLDAWEVVFGQGAMPSVIREGATDEQINADDRIWNSAWRMAREQKFEVQP